jgi:secretion/DNA translocation related TadE-like protein
VRRRRGERGAATLLVVAIAGLLLWVGAALGVVAAMVGAHRSAQAAADLAALSGATRLADGGDPCAEAATVATANGATLTSCTVADRDVRVAVEVAGPRWLGQTGDLGAEARAGPASSGVP